MILCKDSWRVSRYASLFSIFFFVLLMKLMMLTFFITVCTVFALHCTKMYPMALMNLGPLSRPLLSATIPHVLLSSCGPPVPNPILVLTSLQLFAVVCIVGDKTDPCFRSLKLPKSCQWVKIEPLSITVDLRGGLWTNQRPPCVTTQNCWAVFSVSDQ